MPVGFLEEVVEARSYARAKAMVDAADTPQARRALPRTELVQMAQHIEMELGREATAPTPNGPHHD